MGGRVILKARNELKDSNPHLLGIFNNIYLRIQNLNWENIKNGILNLDKVTYDYNIAVN